MRGESSRSDSLARPVAEAQSTPVRFLSRLLLTVVCVGFVGIEAIKFLEDSRARILQARRVVVVDAIVTQSSFWTRRGNRNRRYCDMTFEFRYSYSGSEFVGTRLTNVPKANDCNLLQELLPPRPVGATTKVYHDPQRPSEAFVVENRKTAGYYWVPGLGIVAIVLVGLVAWQPIVTQSALRRYGRWTRLESDLHHGALAGAGVIAALWWVLSCSLAYLAYARSAILVPAQPLDFVFAWITAAGLVGFAVITKIRHMTFEEPVVAVDPYPLRTGQSAQVRVSVRLRRSVTLRNVTVTLLCQCTDVRKRSRTLVQEEYIETMNDSLSAGGTFDCVVPVTPPVLTRQGIPLADELSSMMRWTLHVFLDGVGLKDHNSVFLVEVAVTPHSRDTGTKS